MTEHTDINLPAEILKPILDSGLGGLPEAVSLLVNHAMLIEREHHLGARAYQRTDGRDGHANGFKDRGLDTRIGTLELRVPQVRDSSEPFRPTALTGGSRSERALTIAVAQMYFSGVSTRKVTAILEKLCGLSITSTQVSRAAAQLDGMLEAWRERPIEPVAHLVLDALYEDVRVAGAVRRCAVLVAIGVREGGKRSVLGVSVSLSEAEVHWREFLSSLKSRGLNPTGIAISDAHEGLRAGLTATFPHCPWQRCGFHLQQNAAAHVPKVDMREAVASDIRACLRAVTLAEAQTKLDAAVEKYAESAPKLSDWMARNVPESFTVFSLPEAARKRLRTSNMIENLNMQIRRRTRVVSIFPSEASCLRLISAVLMETSEEWESGKIYLSPKHLH